MKFLAWNEKRPAPGERISLVALINRFPGLWVIYVPLGLWAYTEHEDFDTADHYACWTLNVFRIKIETKPRCPRHVAGEDGTCTLHRGMWRWRVDRIPTWHPGPHEKFVSTIEMRDRAVIGRH